MLNENTSKGVVLFMERWDDNQVGVLLTSATAKLQQQDISGAIELLLQAYQIMPENIPVLNLIGRCYQILGEFERAEKCWEEVKRLDPENNVAEASLSEAHRPAFQFWLKRYRQALTLLEKKNFAEARVLLRQLLEEHDEFVSLYQVLGLSCLAEGDRTEAHRIWHKGLEIDRSNRSLLEYLQLPERRTKVANYKPAQEQPAAKPFFNRSRLIIVTGLLCLALVFETSTLVSNHRQSLQVTSNLQQRIQQLNHLLDQQAVPVSQTPAKPVEEVSMAGSQYDVEQEEHYYHTGYTAYQQRNWKTAVSNLGVVVSMQSGSYLNREALYYLARTHYLQKNYDQAEKYYLLYLDSFPDSNYYDDSLFYLACTYHYTERSEKARETLERLRQLEPNSGYLSSPLYKTINTIHQ